MITYRKQVSPNSTTPASTSGYVIYSLDLNSISTYKMADVEIIASLSITSTLNISTIYYRKLQLVDPALSPSYNSPSPTNIKNSSFNYVADTPSNLYLSEISYVQTSTNNGNIQIKTTNPTGTSQIGTCFVHFKINFY
jgi:hypothetical protein